MVERRRDVTALLLGIHCVVVSTRPSMVTYRALVFRIDVGFVRGAAAGHAAAFAHRPLIIIKDAAAVLVCTQAHMRNWDLLLHVVSLLLVLFFNHHCILMIIQLAHSRQHCVVFGVSCPATIIKTFSHRSNRVVDSHFPF